MSEHVKCIASYDTCYSADSIEWLPADLLKNEEHLSTDLGIFACGTYQLIDPTTNKFIVPGESKDSQQTSLNNVEAGADNSEKAIRKGNIQVFSASTEEPYLEPIQKLDTSASLDLKWSFKKLSIGNEALNILGQADADGQVSLYSWCSSENKLIPRSKISFDHIEGNGNEVLALSLDWSNRIYDTDPFIAVSLSDGSLATLAINTDTEGNTSCAAQQRWKCHHFEAWIAAIDYWNPTTVFSGGDDAKLKGWDTRTLSTPIWVNKSHMMGVCSIQANPHKEHLIATGSYDETLRIFDTRKMRAPLSELSVGGGVWRVRWHPTSPTSILLAAMHNGFHIVNVGQGSPEIVKSFLEHESLAYGADWCSIGKKANVASCSFYDHKLCLW